jgi:hypothetical protein
MVKIFLLGMATMYVLMMAFCAITKKRIIKKTEKICEDAIIKYIEQNRSGLTRPINVFTNKNTNMVHLSVNDWDAVREALDLEVINCDKAVSNRIN